MLEDIKVGDRVINDLGEEATVVSFKVFNNGRARLFLDSPITGWISEYPGKSWSYERDGKFETSRLDGNDIVKIVRS